MAQITPDKLNRSTVTDNGVPTDYAHNGLNQYMAVGGAAFSYDDNFNLTGTGGLLGTYNSANQLVAASNATGAAAFVYDGLGRCVKRTVNGEATVFVFDGWKPIGEFDAWNNFLAWNVYGPGADEILLRQKGKIGYTFFLLDRHGNVSFLVDNDGDLLEKYTYDVFGRPTIINMETAETVLSGWYTHNFLFQGREYISQLGVYDYRNRFYHPEKGRFLQIDPTGFDGGDMNLFRYCGDDPWNRSDPTGLIDSTWSRQLWLQGNSLMAFNQLVDLHTNQAAGNQSSAVTGQHSRPGPKERVGRGSREPSESDEPLRMLPPKNATTEGYGRTAYHQLASHESKPLSGGNLKFQEVATQDPKSDYNINTTTNKPPRELQRGGLYKDHVGFEPEGRPRSNDPPGKGILNVKFRSEYPNGKPGPTISTKMQHVTTHHPNKKPTVGIYVIDP